MITILIRYAEIGVKGANRHVFEEQLRINIQRSLHLPPEQVQQYKTQIVVSVPHDQQTKGLETLLGMYGIAWCAVVHPCENDLESIMRTCITIAEPLLNENVSFRIKAQRSNRNLSFTSPNIEREAGHAVIEATHAPVDIHSPDLTIYVASCWEGAYVYTEKFIGQGGLPVGSSGKVLALLSGGFDSMLAALYLSRRGAQVDFLHFHIYPEPKPVFSSKIPDIVSHLFQRTFSKHLFLASYTPFEMAILELEEKERPYELVLFRRLMALVGERIALEHNYQALILGDSLGQVASQTLENLAAMDAAISLPIFRPLIGLDKHTIVSQIRDLGLFDLATTPYKDCCSLISPEPVTKAFMPMLERVEEKIGMGKILQTALDSVEAFELEDEGGIIPGRSS